MNKYKCHKEVNAKPMNLGDYNTLRGWKIKENENPDTEGYLVEYLDYPLETKLHKDFDNHISWSPKDVFDGGYSTVAPDGDDTKPPIGE